MTGTPISQLGRVNDLRREAERAGDHNEPLSQRLLDQANAIEWAALQMGKAVRTLAGIGIAENDRPIPVDR